MTQNSTFEQLPPAPTTLRHKVFLLLNVPSSSHGAKHISELIIAAIVVSTTTFIVSSMSSLKGDVWYQWIDSRCELTVIAIFTAEYVLRFAVHEGSSLLAFVCSPMNLIDLLAVAPFYLELLISASGGGVLRVLRVVRLLRLFRHSKPMRLFATALYQSSEGLQMLAVLLGVAVIIFSSLLWYVERGEYDEEHDVFLRSNGEPSPFASIPATFWWAAVTITTVGCPAQFPFSFARFPPPRLQSHRYPLCSPIWPTFPICLM
jgi:hypothetical protein